MLPILQIGPFAVQTPGLILLAGIWIGLSVAERHSQRYKINPEALYNLVFTMLVAGILGARLAYVARFPGAFLENPASLISINPGLLDPVGGFAVAVLAGLIYGQRKKMPLWSTLDAITPVLAILLIAIPLSNLASGHAFGSPTELPWAIELWGAQRHPAQIYEALAASFVLWLLWPSRHTKKLASGWQFLQFLVISAGLKVFLEAFRGDSISLIGELRNVQLVAWAFLAIGLLTMNWLSRQVKA